jgi:hypothetical protein
MYYEFEIEFEWVLVPAESGDRLSPGVDEHVVITGAYIISDSGKRISGNIVDEFTTDQLVEFGSDIHLKQ